ncbi:hypothetical protein SDC9_177867 [bioreactor metagenome]|uniref:Uncharacterized protein n=1 Tax=bioreactor metagenome TaxID=1076179 RepID=A0A645GVV7_9ZZZZ
MLLRRPVEGGGDDLPVDGARHIGHLFRALVYEQHHEDDLRVVCGYGVREVLEERRLSGLRRRYDQSALPLADRREYVDDARRYLLAVSLKFKFFCREYRRQRLKMRTASRRLGVGEVDVLHAEQGFVMLLILRRTDDAPHDVAVAQAETPYL